MALDPDALQITEGPGLYTIPVYNASTTTALDAYSAVIVDASNLMNDAGTNNQLAVALPGTTTPGVCIGVIQTAIPALGSGRMIPVGFVTNAVAYGSITAGTYVDNCTVASNTSKVQTHTAAQSQIGIALATVADGETLPIILSAAKDA
jgi:hypothetical protein